MVAIAVEVGCASWVSVISGVIVATATPVGVSVLLRTAGDEEHADKNKLNAKTLPKTRNMLLILTLSCDMRLRYLTLQFVDSNLDAFDRN